MSSIAAIKAEAKAQKSHGGYPPGQSPQPSGIAVTPFVDHARNAATSVYRGDSPAPGLPILPPLWSYQVYVTFGAPASSVPELPSQFLNGVLESMTELYPLRFDFYFLPGGDAETCMAHYRLEQSTRESAGAPLRFIPKYTQWTYHNMLIMIDSPTWTTDGVAVIYFDPPPDCRNDPGSDIYVPSDTKIEHGLKVSKLAPGPGSARGQLSLRLHESVGENAMTFEECRNRYEEALEAGRSSWA